MSEVRYTLAPKINEEAGPFWEGSKEKRLLFQKCSECGHVRWPASIVCNNPGCLSLESEWIESKGEGKIYSFVVFRKAFHPSAKGKPPYVVAVVELDEGVTFLTNIVDCDPEKVECDMPVRIKWEPAADGLNMPMFCIVQ